MADSLAERLQSDLKEAMKHKREAETRTLRGLKAALQSKELEKGRGSLSDDAALQVLQKQARQRRDSISQFEKARRDDLVAKEQEELAIIEAYLPVALSEDEITRIVKEAIDSSGASSPADMGKVMGIVMPEVRGRADGNVVREIVTRTLAT